MHRIVFIIVSLLAAQRALAGDIDLTPGKFTVRQCSVEPAFCASGEVATQLLIAKNNGPPIFDLVIECAFFRGSDFLETGRNFTLNVDTGQTAYIEVPSSGKAVGADHADCRVFAALPVKK